MSCKCSLHSRCPEVAWLETIRGEKLPEVSLTFKAIIQYMQRPFWIRWGGHKGATSGPPTRPQPEADVLLLRLAAVTAYPTGLAEATCWKAATNSDEALEKTGAQTHKNRQDIAESEG